MNSDGLKPAHASPRTGKRTRACDVSLAQRSSVIQIIGEEPLATIHCLTDIHS
jgi:3-polyprenyl-4-hydroxybenzoate decarboxylase